MNGNKSGGATALSPVSVASDTPEISPFAPSAVLNAFGIKATQTAVNNNAVIPVETAASTKKIPTGARTRWGAASKVNMAISAINTNRSFAERVPRRSSKKPSAKNKAAVTNTEFSAKDGV